MISNTITSEDLNYLLPRSLLELLEDQDCAYSSPESGKKTRRFYTSPGVPPLESRLHYYMLNKDTTEKPSVPKLSKFFNDLIINDEIQQALQSIPQKVKLFDYLEQDKFFEQVKNTIQDYENNARTTLNAQATSFIPETNKENINPSSQDKSSKLSNRNY